MHDASSRTQAGLGSIVIHAAGFAALLLLTSWKPVGLPAVTPAARAVSMHIEWPRLTRPTPAPAGGGGAMQPLDASKGRVPRVAREPYVPPTSTPIPDPKLAVAPSILSDAPAPDILASNYGDPLSKFGGTSGGPGLRGGIGTGDDGGIGDKDGARRGPGGDGSAPKAYRPGGSVTAPTLLSKVEPEYSDEARQAKHQGRVLLEVVVGVDGRATDIHVRGQLGMGLDERAIEAVRQWRFKPGTKDGKAVPVMASVEVSFRLL